MMNYFYHHKYQNEDQTFCWVNNCFCKPVENSCVLILHDNHYCCIKASGTEVPTIDPGKLILFKISCRATFNNGNVDALEMYLI